MASDVWSDRWPAGLLVLIASGALGCGAAEPGVIPRAVLGGVVSAATPEAAETAVALLERGATAVEAAVAGMFSLMVSDPVTAGLGARVVVIVVPPPDSAGDPVVISGPSASASATRSGGTPDAVAIASRLLEQFGPGSFTLPELVAPSVLLATEGVALGPSRHRSLVRHQPEVRAVPGLAALFLDPDGSIPAEGALRPNLLLADALSVIRDEGVDAFYARLAVATGGGGAPTVSQRPLTSHRLPGSAFEFLIDPEQSESVYFLRALGLLSGLESTIRTDGPNPVWARGIAHALSMAATAGTIRLTAAEIEAFRGQVPEMGPSDPDETGVRNSPRGTTQVSEPGPGSVPLSDQAGTFETSALVVADELGGVVIVGLSLGAPFGALEVAPGMGFVLPSRSSGVALSDAFAAAVVRDAVGMPVMAAVSTGRGRAVAGGALVQAYLHRVRPGAPSSQGFLATPRVRLLPGPPARVFFEGRAGPSARTDPATGFWGEDSAAELRGQGFVLGDPGRDPSRLDGLSAFFGSALMLWRSEAGWEGAADPRTDGLARLVRPVPLPVSEPTQPGGS